MEKKSLAELEMLSNSIFFQIIKTNELLITAILFKETAIFELVLLKNLIEFQLLFYLLSVSYFNSYLHTLLIKNELLFQENAN